MVAIEQIKAFIDSELGVDMGAVEQDTPLFSEGIIDSFTLISVVMFIEETYALKVGRLDINLANFDSLSKMARYIEASTNSG